MTFMVLMELMHYRMPNLEYSYSVDNDFSSKLPVSIDMTVAMPCECTFFRKTKLYVLIIWNSCQKIHLIEIIYLIKLVTVLFWIQTFVSESEKWEILFLGKYIAKIIRASANLCLFLAEELLGNILPKFYFLHLKYLESHNTVRICEKF